MPEFILHDPEAIYSPLPDYAHALEVRTPTRMLFVAGTMGLDPSGRAEDGLDAQLARIWDNIRAILASAAMGVDNVVRVTSYLRDPSFADANAAARVRALGGRRVPTTAIVAQTLTPDWLVEIEIIAIAE